MKRNRFVYSVLILIIMLLGLLSRKVDWLGTYIGDILWALMVYLILCFLFPSKYSIYLAGYAFLFSFTIEISQLYHAPWIDGIRSTTLGGLVLGFVFLWSDLICYAFGIFIGVLVELICSKKMTAE